MEYKLLAELSTMAASLEEVGKLFALTPEQLKDPSCGIWLVDRIKQLQTAYTIRKEINARVDFPSNPVAFPSEVLANKDNAVS